MPMGKGSISAFQTQTPTARHQQENLREPDFPKKKKTNESIGLAGLVSINFVLPKANAHSATPLPKKASKMKTQNHISVVCDLF
jgi:hypothetical protein